MDLYVGVIILCVAVLCLCTCELLRWGLYYSVQSCEGYVHVGVSCGGYYVGVRGLYVRVIMWGFYVRSVGINYGLGVGMSVLKEIEGSYPDLTLADIGNVTVLG